MQWGQGRDLQGSSESGDNTQWGKLYFSPFFGSVWIDGVGWSAVGVGKGVVASQAALHRTPWEIHKLNPCVVLS